MAFGLLAIAILLLMPLPAAAERPQAGLWRVTVVIESGGTKFPEHVSTRCLRPEQIEKLEKNFVPEQGAACQRTEYEWTGRRLAWRILCTAPVALDNSGSYEFDGPRRYSGTIIVRQALSGREAMSRTRIEGEHVGDCLEQRSK